MYGLTIKKSNDSAYGRERRREGREKGRKRTQNDAVPPSLQLTAIKIGKTITTQTSVAHLATYGNIK